MKTTLFVFILILAGATANFGQTSNNKRNTQLSVTNYTKDTVDVYVTFAAQNSKNKCCPAPAGLKDFKFLKPIPGNSLMGTFKLKPKGVQKFDAQSKCFSGNICFYIPPQCPVPGKDFKHGKYGTNIAEFTLNPDSVCKEAFDISCVNGVNSFIQITTQPLQGWEYGPNNTPVNTIYNAGLTENKGLPGVYPVNCTDCIRLVGAPPCPALPTGPPQSKRICNVQRNGRGGVVKVILKDSRKKAI